jgi:hypothetical protein
MQMKRERGSKEETVTERVVGSRFEVLNKEELLITGRPDCGSATPAPGSLGWQLQGRVGRKAESVNTASALLACRSTGPGSIHASHGTSHLVQHEKYSPDCTSCVLRESRLVLVFTISHALHENSQNCLFHSIHRTFRMFSHPSSNSYRASMNPFHRTEIPWRGRSKTRHSHNCPTPAPDCQVRQG